MRLEISDTENLDGADFEFFRSKIRELCGITQSDSKRTLIQSRLRSRVQALELGGFESYRQLLQSLPPENLEWQVFINLLTTNKTDWFREPDHFEQMVQCLSSKPQRQKARKISVWSAACSTGEEPYTIALVLRRFLGEGALFEVFGSDIDTDALATAKRGIYPLARLSQVPEEYQAGNFAVGTGEISDWMKVRPELKEKVQFQQVNLLKGPYPFEERFDFIFCRNVFIYFSRDIIQRVLESLYDAAIPGATLFTGHSESVQNIKTRWKYIRPSILIKKP